MTRWHGIRYNNCHDFRPTPADRTTTYTPRRGHIRLRLQFKRLRSRRNSTINNYLQLINRGVHPRGGDSVAILPRLREVVLGAATPVSPVV